MNRELIGYFVMYILLGLLILICYLGGCLPSCNYPGNTGGVPGNDTNGTVKSTVNIMNWLLAASVLGIGLSVFSIANGVKLGFAGIATSIVMIIVTLAITKYSAIIAGFGLILTLIGAVLLVSYSIFIKNKAIKEIIIGVQKLKKSVSDGSKTLADEQSKSTQSLVDKVKNNLKVNGQI